MSALSQKELFDEIDTLPIDIKTQIVDKILNSISPIDQSIDDLWIKEAHKRKEEIESAKVSLVDGEEVFKKISQRFKKQQMTYSFHPEAEIELNVSIDYYEECKEDLGLEFANEVYKTIQRILAFPKAWQILDSDIRRCLTNRFPFGIIYYEKNNQVIILAVMQLNRKPDYWKERISK